MPRSRTTYRQVRGAVRALDGNPSVVAALEKIGHAILEDANVLVPVRTRHLRDSGFVDSGVDYYRGRPDGEKNANTTVPTVRVGYTAFYAHMVENGTNDTPREPFLRPAALRKRVVT